MIPAMGGLQLKLRVMHFLVNQIRQPLFQGGLTVEFQ